MTTATNASASPRAICSWIPKSARAARAACWPVRRRISAKPPSPWPASRFSTTPSGPFPRISRWPSAGSAWIPQCVIACPTGAMHIDQDHHNVRRIDRSACIGCRKCLRACPFTPSRIRFDRISKKCLKCDLCKETPYYDSQGKQACVEICPVGAIVFEQRAAETDRAGGLHREPARTRVGCYGPGDGSGCGCSGAPRLRGRRNRGCSDTAVRSCT